MSKKSTLLALFSTEAEYIGIYEAFNQINHVATTIPIGIRFSSYVSMKIINLQLTFPFMAITKVAQSTWMSDAISFVIWPSLLSFKFNINQLSP